MTIKAKRSGQTARRYTDDCYNEKLRDGIDQIVFTLSMPSKGGGVTEVLLAVTSGSFEDVAKAMIGSNQNAAVRAFVSAGYWEEIVQAMMDADELTAMSKISAVLRKNEDIAVQGCGMILLDKCRRRRRASGAARSDRGKGGGRGGAAAPVGDVPDAEVPETLPDDSS